MRADPVFEFARRAVALLAAGGGLILVIASIVQVVAGEPGGAITLAASLPTTALALAVLRRGRPNVVGLLSLIVLVAVVAETYGAITDNTDYVTGIGGEVVVFGLGLLAVFLAREKPRLVAAGFLGAAIAIVVIAQVTLNGSSLEIVTDLVVVVAVLGTVMYVEIRVLESLAVSQNRYSDLARVIPVATFEFDVAKVMARIRALAGNDTELPLDDLYADLMRLVRLSYTNRMAEAMADIFGAWTEFVSGPNIARVRDVQSAMLGALLSGEASGSGEVTFMCRDGMERDFIYQWALGRVAGRSVPDRLVLVATDVTRLRNAEHELERQLEERDQFVASVSHELRTPLTSIMGLTEELVARPDDFDAKEQAELLEIVASETRDVVDIVEDLLVTARAGAGKLTITVEPCDLLTEAERVADLLGDVAVEGVAVRIVADPGRLRQILRNLVSNAQRYGGDDVRVVVVARDGWAVAEVRDNGAPIPLEERARVFEPYERASEAGAVGSVGLGLHVARVLARLMGGDLSYSHDGAESVFVLQLPLSDEQLDVGGSGEVEESGSTGDIAPIDEV